MKVFELGADVDRFEWLTVPSEEEGALLIGLFSGSPLRHVWRPVGVALMKEPAMPLGDFANFYSGAPGLSPGAVERLHALLAPHGEFLPVRALDRELEGWCVFNTTRVLDALDRPASSLTTFPSSGRVMEIERFAFTPRLVTAEVFKIPEMETKVLVSDGAAKEIQSSSLRGYFLEEVWDSETGPTEMRAPVASLERPVHMSSWSHRQLTLTERREIDRFAAAAVRRLRVQPGADAAAAQKAIDADIQRLRERKVGSGKAQAAALQLGALWGETLAREAGWEWCWAAPGSATGRFGLVSPARRYLLFPLHAMLAWITDLGSEPTNLLLFNMVVSGELPPSDAESYHVLG